MSLDQTPTIAAPTRKHRKAAQQELQMPPEPSQAGLVMPERRMEVILLEEAEKYFGEKLFPLVEKQREDYKAAILRLTHSKDAEIRAVGFKNERLESELNSSKSELKGMKNELEGAEAKIRTLNDEIFQNKGIIESLSRADTELRTQHLKLQKDTDYLHATCYKCGQYYQWKRQHECRDEDIKEYSKTLKDISHTSHPHTIWVRD